MKTYKSLAKEYVLSVKKNNNNFKNAKLINSRDVAKFALQFYFDDIEIHESFFIILVNKINNTKGWVKISSGGLSSCIVDPILIAKFAIDSLASGVILVHNHPSGGLIPSKQDIELTNKIKKALELFNILILDHIILCPTTAINTNIGKKNEYYSFADNGIL